MERPFLPIYALLCGILFLLTGCTSMLSDETNLAASSNSQETALYAGRFAGIWSRGEETLCSDEIEVDSDLTIYPTVLYEGLMKNIFKGRNVEFPNQKEWKIPYETIGTSDRTIYFRLFVDTFDFKVLIDSEPCVAKVSFVSSSNSTQSSWMMYALNTSRFSVFLKVCSWSIVSSLDGRLLEEVKTPLSLKFIATKKTN